MRVRSFFALASICAVAAACDTETTGITCVDATSTVASRQGDTATTATGLRYIDVRTGTGTATVTSCATAGIHYTLTVNGVELDSLRDATLVYNVTPGQRPSGTIAGVAEGVLGLQVGSVRRLIVPPALGYGSMPRTNPNTGQVVIPANSTLIFDVEVRQIQ